MRQNPLLFVLICATGWLGGCDDSNLGGGPGDRCDDGDPVTCFAEPPICEAGEILAIQHGCYVCVNPATCLPWGDAECADDRSCAASDYCDPRGSSSCPTCDDCVAACVGHGCRTEQAPTCRAIRPDCGEGNVAVVENGCWVCVDRTTCEPTGNTTATMASS